MHRLADASFDSIDTMTKSTSVFPYLSILVAFGLSLCFLPGCKEDGQKELCQEALDSGEYSEILLECVGKISSEQQLAVGVIALQENDPIYAIEFFNLVEADEPEYGSAQYGLMLAEFQGVWEIHRIWVDYWDMLDSMATSSYQPQEEVEIWQMIANMMGISDMVDDLGYVMAHAAKVVENGYTLEMEEYPFIIGGEWNGFDVMFYGSHSELTARLLWLCADMFIAAVDYISAHKIEIDIARMMEHLPEIYEFLGDFTGVDMVDFVRRYYGWMIAENPGYLEKSPERWEGNIAELKDLLAEMPGIVAGLVPALESTAVQSVEECGEFICLIDLDGSGGLTSGDDIWIGALLDGDLDASLWGSERMSQGNIDSINDLGELFPWLNLVADTDGVKIDMDLTSPDSDVDALIHMSTEVLARVLNPDPSLSNVSPVVYLGNVIVDSTLNNTLLEASHINPIFESLGFDPLPDAFRFYLGDFLDMPLRDLFAFYCEDEDHNPVECVTNSVGNYVPAPDIYPVFPLELETINLSYEEDDPALDFIDIPFYLNGYTTSVPYYTVGDNDHFVGIADAVDQRNLEIQADGVHPWFIEEYDQVYIYPLVYVSPADPTLNGSFKVDLSALPEDCSPEGSSGFKDPSRYSFNKVLNCLLVNNLAGIKRDLAYWLSLGPLQGNVIFSFKYCEDTSPGGICQRVGFYLKIETEVHYSTGGWSIGSHSLLTDNVIEVNLTGVRPPPPGVGVIQAFSPALAYVPLEVTDGEYQLNISYEDVTDVYNLTFSGMEVEVTEVESSFTIYNPEGF